MRYLQASLIFAGAALLAVPEEAGAQTVYETQPAPAPAPQPAPQPAAPSTTVVVPAQPYAAPMYAPYTGAPVYSPYGVAGHSRRVSRRTSRRVSRRH